MSAVTAIKGGRVEYVHSPNSPVVSHGAYSHVVRSGDLVFVGGQLPLDPETGQLVAGGVAEQTEQVMQNLRSALEAAGSGLENVLKVEVQIEDRAHWSGMNEVYCRHFQSPRPPRTTRVSAMAAGVLVEIDCIAVVGSE